MFDYYRFRFSMFRGWNPEFGYELMAPAGIFGAALILFVLFLTSPDFGFLMWRSSVPLPAIFAFGLVVLMLVVTYLADDLKRIGLWLVLCICVLALLATAPLAFELHNRYAQGMYYEQAPAPSAVAIGSAFAAYLLIMLAMTIARVRQKPVADRMESK